MADLSVPVLVGCLAKHESDPGGIVGEAQQDVAADAIPQKLQAGNKVTPIHYLPIRYTQHALDCPLPGGQS
jgi:hypothetical protein